MFKIWLALIILTGLLIGFHSQDLPSENVDKTISDFTNIEQPLPAQMMVEILQKHELNTCELLYCSSVEANQQNAKEKVQSRPVFP